MKSKIITSSTCVNEDLDKPLIELLQKESNSLFKNYYLDILISTAIARIYSRCGFVFYMDKNLEYRLLTFIKTIILNIMYRKDAMKTREYVFRQKSLKRVICLLFSEFFIYSNYPMLCNILTLQSYTFLLFGCTREKRELRSLLKLLKEYEKELRNLFMFSRDEILFYYEKIIERYILLVCKQKNIKIDYDKLNKINNILLNLVREKYKDLPEEPDDLFIDVLNKIFIESLDEIDYEKYPEVVDIIDILDKDHAMETFMKNINLVIKRRRIL